MRSRIPSGGHRLVPKSLNILDSGAHSRLYPLHMPIQEGSASTAFQIGELSRRSHLTVDAIRFYERRNLLPTPIRTTGRFRLYTDNDVERVRFIRQMQMLGFSLAEITRLAQL